MESKIWQWRLNCYINLVWKVYILVCKFYSIQWHHQPNIWHTTSNYKIFVTDSLNSLRQWAMKSMVTLKGLISGRNLICRFSCFACKTLPADINCLSFGMQPRISKLVFLLRFTLHKTEQSLQGMKSQDQENNAEKHIEKLMKKIPTTLMND